MQYKITDGLESSFVCPLQLKPDTGCVYVSVHECECVYTVSLGQDCISPLFNEVLRPPTLSALDTSCHYRALVTGGGMAV